MDGKTIPILPCRDVDETIRFYGTLGFTLEFEQREPSPYLILAHGEIELHFVLEPGLDPASSNSMCYLRVPDADAVWSAWSAIRLPETGIPRLIRPADRDWGMRELALVDPSGNLLRIGHPLP